MSFERYPGTKRGRPITHGASSNGRRTTEYYSWNSMRQRTTNPRCHIWKYYGGRGIKCCDQWKSFDAFLSDMGPKPSGCTLGRINNDGDYEPGNCRWETRKQQANNRRPRSRTVGYYSDLAEKSGLPYSVIYMRIRSGWSIEKAVSTPKRFKLR